MERIQVCEIDKVTPGENEQSIPKIKGFASRFLHLVICANIIIVRPAARCLKNYDILL